MKTNTTRKGLGHTIALGLILAGLGFGSSSLSAADQVKGAQKLSELNRVKTIGDLEALNSGDTFAMACSKCETIVVSEVVKTAKGAEVLASNGKPRMLFGKHPCAGCASEVTIVGHGKAKTDKITHTCSSCGDKSAFCCVTKRK